MKNIGIFYGSSTGMTSELAQKIANKLNIESNVFDVSNADPSDVSEFEVLLLGCSTWGVGELQDDWDGFLPKLKEQDLRDKLIGLFGTGDSDSYPDSFCEALSIIKEKLSSTGCKFIGSYTPEDYNYDCTKSEENGQLIGLCIDDVNQEDLTDKRIELWVSKILSELS